MSANHCPYIIEIRDFETGELKNEIYTYGEQTIVMDLDLVNNSSSNPTTAKSAVDRLAEQQILRKIKRLIPKSKVGVEVISPERANIYINEKYIPKIIGKNGKRIAEIEKDIGISLGVEILENTPEHLARGEKFEVDIIHTKKQLILDLGKVNGTQNFDIFVGGEYLLTATTSRKGEIKIKRGIELSDILLDAIEMGLDITAVKK